MFDTVNTIRHLRTTQIVGQVHHRVRRFLEKPDRFADRPVPRYEGCRWPGNVEFIAPQRGRNEQDSLCRGEFSFLNDHRVLGWPPKDWQAADAPKLWQYNLHYFEWLWLLDYAEARRVIVEWTGEHVLAKGRVGWEPYPISLRLMNWCCVCFGKYRDRVEQDKEFAETVWRSVFLQAEWLMRHIETHLLGNHLFENGAALVLVGSCFHGEVAQRWMARGLAILREQIPEQIPMDGMHFERSPMYHVRMTYLLRLLSDTRNDVLVRLVSSVLPRMLGALSCLRHPDGEIALLNDSAFGIYNTPAELLGDEPTAPPGPWALMDAGYYGYRGEDGSYIVCDAGAIGPDYIPGHAHGDMFSFELSLKGTRVIVDSGVFDYVPGEMRRYCRSTRAHNTVEVQGQDQCEFWGAFRVARRGHPHDVSWSPTDTGFRLSGWHDGYRRLAGKPIHQRMFAWESSGRLEVRDVVRAEHFVQAASVLHLHPECRIRCLDTRSALVDYACGQFEVVFIGDGILRCESSLYCREFGCMDSNFALTYSFEGKEPEAAFSIASR